MPFPCQPTSSRWFTECFIAADSSYESRLDHVEVYAGVLPAVEGEDCLTHPVIDALGVGIMRGVSACYGAELGIIDRQDAFTSMNQFFLLWVGR